MTNSQNKTLGELNKIKDEIKKLGATHEMVETDIKNTVHELKSANERVNELINVLTKIKNRLNNPLMSSVKDEHKVSSS